MKTTTVSVLAFALALSAPSLGAVHASAIEGPAAADGTTHGSGAALSPALQVAAAGEHQDHDMAGMAGMVDDAGSDAAVVKVGDIEISGGAVKAMLPGAKVGGGGMTIRNGGPTDDRLVSVESPVAGGVELHEMTMQGDVMKMRKIEGGIALPAGQTVELKGGGLHMMFMNVAQPFAEGMSVPVTLTFEKAGKVDYVLPVGNVAGIVKPK